jgi:hypothetical protein
MDEVRQEHDKPWTEKRIPETDTWRNLVLGEGKPL